MNKVALREHHNTLVCISELWSLLAHKEHILQQTLLSKLENIFLAERSAEHAVRASVCLCVHACMRVCVHTRVRACMRACMHVCMPMQKLLAVQVCA